MKNLQKDSKKSKKIWTAGEFKRAFEKKLGHSVEWDKSNEDLPEGMMRAEVRFFSKKGKI